MRPATDTSSSASNVRDLHRQALGNLRYIRETIDFAGAFTALPGTAGIVMGVIGLLATAVAAVPAFRPHWLPIWIGAASVAITAGSLLIAYKAATTGITLYRGPARRFALSLAPTLLAGAILTAVLARAGLPDLIPGTWLVLYGAAVISASVVSVALIAMMGGCFMVLGLLAFLAPSTVANLLLGAGFGGLHLIFGWILARQHDG